MPHSSAGSVSLLTGAQVPASPPVSAARHDSHSPSQAASQHTSSPQMPLMHSPRLHALPLGTLQTPAPSHTSSPSHSSSGSLPTTRSSHTPSSPSPFTAAVQASHTPSQAASQHTPSAQMPLTHSRP